MNKIPNNIQEIVDDFTKRVSNILKDRVKKIILYGSYARGDFNDSSDIDIMILTDLSDEEIENYRDEISDIAYDIELDTGVMLSPIVKNIEKYNMRIDFIPFYKNVQKEGVVLVNG